MILSVNNLTKTYDAKTILRDVSFHIEAHDKLAVTGINGAGKTTLLRLLIGEEAADSGSVAIPKDIRVGYLPQNPEIDSARTVYDEILSVKSSLADMEKDLRSLEQEMNSVPSDSPEIREIYDRYSALTEKYESEGGYAVRSNVTGILKGLGFSEEEFSKKVSHLSGGQKTRLMLGRLLLSSPELLILDEPTNHLDIDSVTWLESYLKGLKTAVILVSHDRYFLDRIVNKILDIDNTRARLYTGNYSAFSEKKALLRKDMMKAYLNNQAELKHQQEVIEKLRSFNREKSIKRAESRVKMLEKMERVEKPFDTDDAMKLHFVPYRTSGNDVLYAENLSKSYGSHLLFSGVTLDVKRKEKLCIIGPNGTGKTTLLRIINTAACRDQIAASESSAIAEHFAEPDTGTIEFGTRVGVAYYDQEHQVLDPENTVFDEISDAYPYMNQTEIRNLLASFLFTGDDVFKQIRELSGGEKGRLSLAKLMLSKANLLLLDEPTNHLDITSKEILEEALRNYEGTVICVSHDRYFINRTSTRILELDSRHFVNYNGNYDYYLEKKADPSFDPSKAVSGTVSVQEQIPSVKPSGFGVSEEKKGLSFEEQKELRSRRQKLQNRLQQLENEVSVLEEQIAAAEEKMADPETATNAGKLHQLSLQKEEMEGRLNQLYASWEEAQEALDTFDLSQKDS